MNLLLDVDVVIVVVFIEVDLHISSIVHSLYRPCTWAAW